MPSVMNSALSQRMDASLVQQVAWQKELDELNNVAKREGLRLVVDTPSDVLIPTPLYSLNLVMEIHRMRQMPLRAKIGWMEVHTPYPYLLAETSALFLQPSVDVEAGTETRDDIVRFPPAVTRVSNATTNTRNKIKSKLDAIKTNLPPTPTRDRLTEHIDSIGLVLFIITVGTVIVIVVKCKKRNKGKLEQRQPMGGPTNTIKLGYPAMPPPMTPDRPPNYACPGNRPSFDPACSQPKA